MTLTETVTTATRNPRAARPSDVSTETATCTLAEGLTCAITSGGVHLKADMPAAYGGNGSAPNPGVYVRAGMASCLAIVIKMIAREMDLDLGSIRVDLDMDFDSSADAATPAPLETRFRVSVTGDADDGILADLLDQSLARDPFYEALREAQSLRTEIKSA